MFHPTEPSSRLPGFYQRRREDRLKTLIDAGHLSPLSAEHLERGGGLDPVLADRMSENVVSTIGLPLAVALNFRINQRDRLVPMAVEEPSIVAAASNAARLARISGGFFGTASAPRMTAQVHLFDVTDPMIATVRILAHQVEILAEGDQAIPRMVSRGGGCRELEVRTLDANEGLMVVHIDLDVGEAMGANLADAVAEAAAPRIAAIAGAQVGLRILSNLPLKRRVQVFTSVDAEALGGKALADRIVLASRFAELDVHRAVTHNKGIMNGIDAAALALGQDWRAIEAGAHGYAALGHRYAPLSRWERTETGVLGKLELPLAAATVGGSTRAHPGVRAAFELLGPIDAKELAIVLASAGLATNLAALRALAGEGIQRGHLKLHRRKVEPTPARMLAAKGGEG